MTAVCYLQTDYATWSYSHGQRSPYHRRSRCTRIHLHGSLHSFRSTGRCHGRAWWTSDRSGSSARHCRRYPSTQPRVECSWTILLVPRTYCTRRGTTSCCCATAGRTSACSGRSVSADWAVRCRASSCLWSRWSRLWTPPTNGWRSWTRRRSAGSAEERSWLQRSFTRQRCIEYSAPAPLACWTHLVLAPAVA